MNTRIIVPTFLILALSVAMYAYLTQKAPQVEAYELAAQMLEKCATGAKSECYENNVPLLYPEYSIPELFEVIRLIREKDPQYQFCHVLAHKLGEAVVAEDPNAWMKAMALNPPDGMCSNGFVHGVVGGRFRAEVLDDETLTKLEPEFRAACQPHDDWNPSPLDQAICYHGMGHLYVFITDADLRKALSICENTTVAPGQDYGQVCREGVFMQIYQPLEPDDFLMIERMAVKPSTTTVRQFCAAYRDNPKYEGACLRESWPFFRDEILNGTGLKNFCAGQPNKQEEINCYRSATAIIGRMTLSRSADAAGACNAIPTEYQAMCFTTVATAILEEDRLAGKDAVAMCEKASASIAAQCHADLAQRSNFIYGNNDAMRKEFCTHLPESYRATCGR